MTEEEFLVLTGQKSPKKSPQKYRNKKVYVFQNGYASTSKEECDLFGKPIEVFDSVKEFNRWNELRLLERAGVIANLDRQSEWEISAECKYNGDKVRKIVYKADFQYTRDGEQVVEDVKPYDKNTQKYRTTKDFQLKWKLLKAKYPGVLFEIF